MRNPLEGHPDAEVVYEIVASDVYEAKTLATDFAQKWGIPAFSLKAVTHFELVLDYIAEEDGELT